MRSRRPNDVPAEPVGGMAIPARGWPWLTRQGGMAIREGDGHGAALLMATRKRVAMPPAEEADHAE